MELTERPPYLRAIQEVTKSSDLQGQSLTIRYWDGNSFETMTLPTVYPFMTIRDVKSMLYGALRSNYWLPSYVFLGRNINEDANNDTDAIYQGTDALFYDLDNPEAKEHMMLYSPLKICSARFRPDKRFVDAFGEKIQTGEDEQDRLTLEDLFLADGSDEYPVLDAFCLADMLRYFGLGEEQIPSAKDWNGRFRIYFPALTLNTIIQTPSSIAAAQRRQLYVQTVLNMLSAIDASLQADEPTVNMTIKNVMALRLLLKLNELPDDFHLDQFFFETTVNERRPFMRLLPSSDEPITKIHVQGIIPIPSVADPQLLLEWKDEISPTGESDYLFMKISTRDVKEGGLPLYSTLRIYDDSTADVVVIPTKQHGDGLEPLTELRDYDTVISDATRATYLENAEQRLGEVSLTLNLALERGDRRLTREILLERTRVFSYFFTEIPAYTAVKPIIMLRYRAVSNYRAMNNIFTFFKQHETESILKGKMTAAELMDKTAVEFNITLEEARNFYKQFLEDADEFTLAVPELGTFKEKNAPGIDIGIFGAHPIYTVQIYRCDSLEQLQRIYTILSLFLTLDIQPPVQREVAESVSNMQNDVDMNDSESSGEFYDDDRGLVGKSATVVPRTMMFNSMSNTSEEISESDEDLVAPKGKGPFAGVAPDLEEPSESEEEGSSEEESNSSSDEEEIKPVTVRKKVPKSLMFLDSESEDEAPPPAKAVTKQPVVIQESDSPSDSSSEMSVSSNNSSPEPVKKPAVKKPAMFSKSMFFDSNSDNSQAGGGKKKAVEENNGKTAELVLFNYLIKQLRKADPTLFDGNDYVRRCQANSGQQPIVLTEQEYQRMMKEYADDDGMRIITYPLAPGEKEPTMLNETYTVVKYGTKDKIAAQNYYMCPTLFCLKDRIMIRPKDFYNDKWRQGYEQSVPKPKEACPFCGGREIRDKDKGTPGYTVYKRQPRPKSKNPDEGQVFVGFTGKQTDDGYGLPCCFVKKKTLRVSDPEFAHIAKSVRKAELRGVEPTAVEEATAAIEEAQRRAFEKREITDYEILRFRFDKEYIVASNRWPLEGGVFGLLPPALDRLFQQSSNSLVIRVAIRQTLASGAAGFFRLGTQGANRGIPDSFFGLVAPYINVNTIDEAKEKFRFALSDPNIFTALNYGNLVTEFYNPCDPVPTDEEVIGWAGNFKPLEKVEKNMYEARRIFMAHRAFLEKIDNRKEYKEFRTFAPILAVPGLITPNGLILIIIEHDPESPESPPRILCPPFGYNPELHRGCDIGFVLRNNKASKERGYIYEALMYARNNPATGIAAANTETFMTFNTYTDAGRVMTPEIVKTLKKEFIPKCISTSRAIYSAQSGVRPSDMVTLSQLVTLLGGKSSINSVVRDIYNHIVGVTFKKRIGKRDVLIPFAVADDGVVMRGFRLHLGWNSVEAASPDIIASFYNEELAAVLTQRTRYQINKIFFNRGNVTGIRLESGVILPAGGKTANLPAEMTTMLKQQREKPEYELNRQLFLTDDLESECDDITNKIAHTPDDLKTITRAQLEELYQHFRISVAHWMGSDEVTNTGLLDRIEDVIFRNDLPLYERRRRLWLLIADRVRSWFLAEDDWIPKKPILLRRDCRRIIDAGQCDRACAWVEDGSDKPCKIHIPTELGANISTKDAFVERVITELLQFRERRLQILQDRVPVIGKVTETIRDDDQLILPDSSPTWLELLVSEWSAVELPRHYEEMTGPGERQRVRPSELEPVPSEITNTFELGPEDWSVWAPNTVDELLTHLGFSREELCMEGDEFTDSVFTEMVKLRKRSVFILRGNQSELFKLMPKRTTIPAPRALVIVIMPDGRLGLLVSNDDYFTIPLVDALPSRLKVRFTRQILVDPKEQTCAPTVEVTSSEEELSESKSSDMSTESSNSEPAPIIVRRAKTAKVPEPTPNIIRRVRTKKNNTAPTIVRREKTRKVANVEAAPETIRRIRTRKVQ